MWMEEEQLLNPLAVAHLLQHTLRSLCTNGGSQWVYAVFWRILPRNYPPPKWDLQGGGFDRSRSNRRNWILVWEDGYCNFAASAAPSSCAAGSSSCTGYVGCAADTLQARGLQPELFFKMSHEIYSYGEGMIGKVAADLSHKWVFKDPPDSDDASLLSAWNGPTDAEPRTWEAQFQCGIQTIALIAVREGVIQLGAVNKVMQDLSYVILLRKRFSYLESIPGVLLPHPSSSASPFSMFDDCYQLRKTTEEFRWAAAPTQHATEPYGHMLGLPVRITTPSSMDSALLSTFPPVSRPLPSPPLLPPAAYYHRETAANLSPMPGEVIGSQHRMVGATAAMEEIKDQNSGGMIYGRSMEYCFGDGAMPAAWQLT